MTWEADVLPLNYSRFLHFRATIGPQSGNLGPAHSAPRPAIRQKQSSTRATLYAVLFLVLTAAPAFAQTVSLPFVLNHDLMVVQVKIDGAVSSMVVDTGSPHSFSNDPTAIESLRPNSRFGFYVRKDDVLIAVSREYCMNLAVGRVSMAALSKFVGHRVDGILGQDFLSTFESVKINYKTHAIELVK